MDHWTFFALTCGVFLTRYTDEASLKSSEYLIKDPSCLPLDKHIRVTTVFDLPMIWSSQGPLLNMFEKMGRIDYEKWRRRGFARPAAFFITQLQICLLKSPWPTFSSSFIQSNLIRFIAMFLKKTTELDLKTVSKSIQCSMLWLLIMSWLLKLHSALFLVVLMHWWLHEM